MAKFLVHQSGAIAEAQTISSSTGSADAGKIVGLDGSGRLDSSVMPVGIGADTATITASEALAAGDFVNIWNSAGSPRVRKADAATAGKEAHGFVLSSVSNGSNASLLFEGTNTQITGQTPGVVFLSATTPGAATTTPPTGSGQVVQRIGFATATTAVNFQSQPPIVLS